ncbi:MAG: serine/threonine protein kinase [Prevotella sp.]|nr:serine/threonine protein kinase [Prevotella sp.]
MSENKKKYEYVLPIGAALKSPEGEYSIKKVLGQGGFGITYQARGRRIGDNVFHKYAIKEFFIKGQCWREENDSTMRYSPAAKTEIKACLKDFKDEALRLNKICRGNRFIVNVNEVFEANGTIYYVMEYLEGGSLRDKVRENGMGLSEGVALSYIRPIAEAVEYIHCKYHLLHCDIKPDNIMLRLDEEGQPLEPVLIDFGISIHFSSKGELTTTHNAVGITPGYSPQEQFQGLDTILQTRRKLNEEGHADLSIVPYEMDVYALGATLYYLLTGLNPAPASYGLEKIIEKKLSELNISERTKNVIINAMRQPYMERTKTAEEFLKGFEERYYLPRWFVLKSPNATYQVISGLKTETGNSLCYDAVMYTGDEQSSDGNATLSHRYTLYEYFVKGIHQRRKDESVISTSDSSAERYRQEFFSTIQREVGLVETGQYDCLNTGLVVREVFQANGTIYAVSLKGWKKPNPVKNVLRKYGVGAASLVNTAGKVIRDNSGTIGRLLLYCVLITVLSIGGYYGYNRYKEYSSVHQQKPERQLKLDSIAKVVKIQKHDIPLDEPEAVQPQNPKQEEAKKMPLNISLKMINTEAGSDGRCYVSAIVRNPNSKEVTARLTIKGSAPLKSITQNVTVPAEGSKNVRTYFVVTKSLSGQSITATTSSGEHATINNIRLTPYDNGAVTPNTPQTPAPNPAQEQEYAAKMALKYVNGERTYENHQKAYQWAQKADAATKAKVIQRLKDMDFPIP